MGYRECIQQNLKKMRFIERTLCNRDSHYIYLKASSASLYFLYVFWTQLRVTNSGFVHEIVKQGFSVSLNTGIVKQGCLFVDEVWSKKVAGKVMEAWNKHILIGRAPHKKVFKTRIC